jgi:hypothetical protein
MAGRGPLPKEPRARVPLNRVAVVICSTNDAFCASNDAIRKRVGGGFMAASEGGQALNEEVISLGGISASWLAKQLDNQGVVRLRDVFSYEWLEAMRVSVADNVAGHGDGDFFIPEADHTIGSPAHQLASDPTLRQLFSETARLRWPKADLGKDLRFAIPVRAGTAPKWPSNLFHYDATVLTMIVPIFIPRTTIGNGGELAAFGNKRPFRRFVASHLLDTILTHNSLYRRYVTKRVLDAPEKYIVALEPGDAYVFWGYRTLHGNLFCGPGQLRAVLVVHYGEVHSDSRALSLVWRFGRSRRNLRRYQYLPADSADTPLPDELHDPIR